MDLFKNILVQNHAKNILIYTLHYSFSFKRKLSVLNVCFADPATYSSQQIERLVDQIVGLQHQDSVDQVAMNQLSNQLSTLLDVSSEKLNDTSSRDVIVAAETVTNQYDISQV